MQRSLRTPLTPRDLYRALLREASYLPPICQPYAKTQIRERWRKHIYDDKDDPRTKSRLRKAMHHLRHLWGANHGMFDNMFRVLLLTYGRIGYRRRSLIKQLLQKPAPADSDALAKQIEGMRAKPEGTPSSSGKKLPLDWLDKWNTEKLHALAASQMKQSFYAPKAELKAKRGLNPETEVPETTIWGRPPPAKLKRSKIRKWYTQMVDKTMPPVGRDEWEMLRLLARGEADRSLWELPPRRPVARSEGDGVGTAEEDGKKRWDWKSYATQAVVHVERGQSRSQKGRTGEEVEGPYGSGQAIGVNDLGRARLWRRWFAKIWAMTPVMEKDASIKSGWKVEWGKVQKDLPVATSSMEAFFEGATTTNIGKQGRRRGQSTQ